MVSVIVPARNEEASLRTCLESLMAQTGVTFEVIVVDDGSTDRTCEIARSFPRVRVVDPGPLPQGWSGKNNALVAGASEARGEWLLFTDADTVHHAGSLARSIAEALRQRAALLSYSPEQEVDGLWEKAVMPVIFAELASTYRPSEVSNPASAAAAANGQYILVSRDAYDSSWWTCGGCHQLARGRGAGPGSEGFGSQSIFSLRRRCRANAHVSQLCAATRRLDQKSGAAVSFPGAAGCAAAAGVCSDLR